MIPFVSFFSKCAFLCVLAWVSAGASSPDADPLKTPTPTPTPTPTLTPAYLKPIDSEKSRDFIWALKASAMRGMVYCLEHPWMMCLDNMALSGRSGPQTIGEIYRTGGLRRFYSGSSTIVGRAAIWAPRFGLYKELGDRSRIHGPFVKTAVTAAGMTLFDIAFLKPLDVMRIAMTTSTDPRVLRESLRRKVLYRNTLPVMGTSFATWFFYLGTDMAWRYGAMGFDPSKTLSLPQIMAVGALTTLTSGFVSAPFRLVSTRMQAPGAEQRGGLQGLKMAYAKIGSRGFLNYSLLASIAYMPGNIVAAWFFYGSDHR